MTRHLSMVATFGLGLLVGSCSPTTPEQQSAKPPAATEEGIFPKWAFGLFAPLPVQAESPNNPLTAAKIELGRTLYFDRRLSNARDVTCNSCHPLDAWGTIGRRSKAGDWCRAGRRDAPTVYNAAVQLHLFWDGRSETVEDQVKETLLSPIEMDNPDEEAVLVRLRASQEYQRRFQTAFPEEEEPLTFDNVAKAIGAFERTLLTPSRWDHFLQGDSTALTDEEKKGFETFVIKGCSDCHHGIGVGGRMYQLLGEATPWPASPDSGRYFVTGKQSDIYVFKVPSLRNVAQTGPYFQNALVPKLPAAIRMMARYQRRLELSDADVASIVAWLNTLTGERPKEFAPKQPGS